MKNFIIIAILAIVIGAAIAYIIKAKKSGAKCIGCPAGGNCPSKTDSSSSCSCGCNNKD